MLVAGPAVAVAQLESAVVPAAFEPVDEPVDEPAFELVDVE